MTQINVLFEDKVCAVIEAEGLITDKNKPILMQLVRPSPLLGKMFYENLLLVPYPWGGGLKPEKKYNLGRVSYGNLQLLVRLMDIGFTLKPQ